jgi:hypothetical protein
MFNKLNKFIRIKKPYVLYPPLLIVSYILTKTQIIVTNPKSAEVLLFLALNLVAIWFSSGILTLILKDRLKAWLVSFLLFALLLYFGKISSIIIQLAIIKNLPSFIPFSKGTASDLLLMLLLFVVGFFTINYRGNLVRLTQYFNLVLVFIIIYQLLILVTTRTNRIVISDPTSIDINANKTKFESYPSIYYIILDGYTSNQSLKDYWGYNNEDFTNFLKCKGFFVASNSKSNYNMTPYSIASSLNISYLKNCPKAIPTDAQEKNLFNLVETNYVVRSLMNNNYKIINHSFFDFPSNPKTYDDFFFLITKRLISETFYEKIAKKLNKSWTNNQSAGLLSLKDINIDILNNIGKEFDDSINPVFLYAHIMMPHDPYIFDEDGKMQVVDSALNIRSKDGYLNQLKFLNKQVKNTITKIMEVNCDRLPVIIVQGDHGWRYLNGTDQIKESTTILNAYFFPDGDYRGLYSTVSPVNTFRILFNKYFNTKLTLLRDSTYNVFVF